jgi:Sec-independent protein secretion pathway component TatC
MKTWQTILVWALLIVLAATILPGVDPIKPTVLAIVLIVAFELVRRRFLTRR